MLVEAWLLRAAAAHPERAALQTPDESMSYAELLSDARAGAAELIKRGVRPGQRVGIALPAGLAFARALHACLLLGAIAVPVDLRLGAAERQHIIDGTAALVQEPLGENVTPLSPAAEESGAPPPPDDLFLRVVHDLDSTAVVIHTSGSTSTPKPVELTYGNLLWSALGSAVALGSDSDERWLCTLPVSHIGGLSILVRSAIYASTAVLHEHFQTERVLRALREDEITLVSLVPTTLARLLDGGLEHPPTLRCALTGGGPAGEALLERARAAGVPLSQTYGLTEACSQVTTTPTAAIYREGQLGGGVPLFCTRLRIAEDGEIMLAGPTVAPAMLDRAGWLTTGDLGRLDEDGHLHVTGRSADTIVSGGENVAPAEVEAVIEAHPDVLEAAVLARPDPEWGEVVTAVVVPRAGAVLEADALRAHCAGHLAAYKVPKHVTFLSEPLPRTRSGKLLRRELR